MKFLRTVSTSRLLAMIAGLVAAIAACTAIAVAAAGTGPVPPPKPLAQAVHDALGRPMVKGLSARISFTNHLIDSSDIQGIDPILTGASGRLWLSNDRRLRVELQSDNGDAQLVVDDNSFWAYDPASKTVYTGKLPASVGRHEKRAGHQLPSLAQIQSDIANLAQHFSLSGAIPSDVAGQAAYTVRISPKHNGGLLGAAELAWDALRGVPLRIALYAKHDSSPVLELKATDISFGPVPASVFSISWPSGAKVVKLGTIGAPGVADHARTRLHRDRAEVTGATAVARRLQFKLVAPGELGGMRQSTVRLLDWGGSPAALVTFGQGLGGIAVIEQTADSARSTPRAGDAAHRGLTLPTVSINGASGQELKTALGTMIHFTQGGVTYTVLGSVPAAVAEAAARAL
jgi:outer membrane lipoprotein-sorting protein